MSEDTTTIEVTEEQRDRLSERKQHDRESYKAVIARMLDGSEGDDTPTEGVDVDALVDELKNELSMANEPGVQVDTQGLIERLERIEAAASTVEERTGSIERQLEDMGGR